MATKYAKNSKGERYHYSEKDREEIRRGTSWFNPKYLDYTEKQFKAEMKRLVKVLKNAKKNRSY